MSYYGYIGALGVNEFTDAIDTLSASIAIDIINTSNYILETSNILINTKLNVAIANQINLDTKPLTDVLQEIVTDAAGTALGDLIGETTQVPSALGQSLITLSALGLLAYNKLNRTSVQDVDSMVYSADYSSILTPGMFDDRVRIRYDTNQFSNVFYTVGGVKKGEILTSRLNLLPVDSNNIDLYTSTGKVGIGTATPATPLHIYNATNNILRLQTAPVDGTNSIEFVRGSTADPLNDYRLFTDTAGKFKLQYSTNTLAYGGTGSDIINTSGTNINLYKDTEITGKLGIGTTAETTLHTYHATNNILRLQTGTGGTTSIEFVRGTDIDAFNDYRFVSDTGTLKLQYEDNLIIYGGAGSDLLYASPTQLTLIKKTQIDANVGIGTTPHATYKLDVLGDTRTIGNVGIATTPHATYKLDVLGEIRATEFRGVGSNITALNEANLILTTAKIYERFNTTNFAIIDDKIDLPPNYSFNITGYDSQTLYGVSAERKYKGKITANYDDRDGIYKLITTDISLNNKAVLKYKAGDKITIRNTANPIDDYLLYSGFRYFNSLYLVRRPNNIPLEWAVVDVYSVGMYEWRSGDGLEGRPNATIYAPNNKTFPFTTAMTFLVETGFNYYLFKTYNIVDYNGSGTIFINATSYGDDSNGFNSVFGAGQTFKLQEGSGFSPYDYLPKGYISADIGISSTQLLGGVKKGRGVAIDATTGVMDAIPVSSDLITNMKAEHFINNVATGKIEISSAYVAPNATKLATSRNIAGVGFDGSAAIDIPYANLTSKPTLFSGSYTDLTNKPTLFSGSYDDLSNKPAIPAAQVSSDWTATTGVALILNKPALFSGSYDDLSNKPTIPAAQVSSDWSATTGVALILNKPALFSGSYTDLSNKPTIPAAQVSNDWNATTGVALILNKPSLITITDINNTSNYTTRINSQLITADTALGVRIDNTSNYVASVNTTLTTSIGTKQATLTSANTIGVFNTTQFTNNVGTSKIDILSTWKPSGAVLADTATALATTRTIGGTSFNGTANIAVALASTATALATARNIAGTSFNGTADISIDYTNLINVPWVRSVVAVNNAYMTTSRYVKIGGTTSEPAYPLDVTGDVNASGAIRVGGTSIASKWATNANGISYNTGNVGIGANLPTYKLEVNGYVKSNVVAFHAKSNHGTYTYAANTRITGVASQGWDAIMLNNTAWNATTGVFTVAISGVYMVACSAYLASNNHAFSIRRNATTSTTGDEYAGAWIGVGSGVVASDRSYFSSQAVMNLLVADTISVWSGGSGCAISNGPANSISVYLIMPT